MENPNSNICVCGAELYWCNGVFEIKPHPICVSCKKSGRYDKEYFSKCIINNDTIKKIRLCTSCDIDDAGCDD